MSQKDENNSRNNGLKGKFTIVTTGYILLIT